jgi:ORF6N domain
MDKTQALISTGGVERRIVSIRGIHVMLDVDLAALYRVETRVLVQAVKRNPRRFPADFMFQLSREEFRALTSQPGFSRRGRGGRRHSPYAFTEQGVAMLSSVLRSEEAVEVNVEVMRAFVRLRAVPAILDHFHKRMDALEERYDTKFKDVFDAIRALMESPESGPSSGPDPQPIGFRPHLDLGNLHDGALGMRPEEAVRGI